MVNLFFTSFMKYLEAIPLVSLTIAIPSILLAIIVTLIYSSALKSEEKQNSKFKK